FAVSQFERCLTWIEQTSISFFPSTAQLTDAVRAMFRFTTGWYQDAWYPLIRAMLAWVSDAIPDGVVEALLIVLFTLRAGSGSMRFCTWLENRRGLGPFKERLAMARNHPHRWRVVLAEIVDEMLFQLSRPAEKLIQWISGPVARWVAPEAERLCGFGMEKIL